jgi:hypothetical protein
MMGNVFIWETLINSSWTPGGTGDGGTGQTAAATRHDR